MNGFPGPPCERPGRFMDRPYKYVSDCDGVCAVTDLFDTHAELLHDRQQDVGLWCVLLAPNMKIPLDRSPGVAGDDRRNPFVTVHIGIAHGASIENQRIIEQVAVAIAGALQLLEEIRQEAHMIPIDLRQIGNQRWHVLMV